LDLQDENGQRVLHVAAASNSSLRVPHLISKGANKHVADVHGMTALDYLVEDWKRSRQWDQLDSIHCSVQAAKSHLESVHCILSTVCPMSPFTVEMCPGTADCPPHQRSSLAAFSSEQDVSTAHGLRR
jgi:hypothetical protein